MEDVLQKVGSFHWVGSRGWGMGFCRSFVQLLLDGLKDFWRAFDIHSFVFIVFFRKQF